MNRRSQSIAGLYIPGWLPGPLVLTLSRTSVRLHRPDRQFAVSQRDGTPQLDQPTVPPPASNRGDRPADLVLVIDDSGSTETSDPQGWRYVAGRRIVNLLVDGLGGKPLNDRVAVIHFSDYPRPWLSLTPVHSRAGQGALRTALRPVTGGGTRIVPAIEKAAGMLRASRNRDVVVLLFTDGESNESSDELRAACQRLSAGTLQVLALGDRLPEQWNHVPVGSVVPTSMIQKPDDIEWAMAKALYRSLSLAWSGPDNPR